MKDIKDLYNTLYENASALSKEEYLVLVKDFLSRKTQKIDEGNGGNYRVKRECNEYIFNGFLILNPNTNSIIDFKLFLDTAKEIRLKNEDVLILVNCSVEKVEAFSDVSAVEPEETSDSLESKISSLERLSRLYADGVLSDEEFQSLKAKLLS